MRNMSRKIKKQTAQNREIMSREAQREQDRQTMLNFKLYLFNLLLAAALWVCSSHLPTATTIVLSVYEVIMFVVIMLTIKGRSALRKYLGVWCLIVPFASRFWINTYIYENAETLSHFGRTAIILLCISVVVALLIALVVKQLCVEIKMDWMVAAFVMIPIIFGTYAQITNLNEVLGSEKIAVKTYAIADKYDESFKSLSTYYHLCIEEDRDHTAEVIVSKEHFKKAEVGDELTFTVCKGFFGIDYLRDVREEAERQIEEM